MKKLLTIFLGIALIFPLYSQDYNYGGYDYDYEYWDEADGYDVPQEEPAPPPPAPKPKPPSPPPIIHKQAPESVRNAAKAEAAAKDDVKKKKDYVRKYFEIGLDASAGFDNGLAGVNDIFKKNIVLDMKKIAGNVPDNGAGFNFGFHFDHFVKIKNINILEGVWDFGLIIANVDGDINVNIPKSLFGLVADGNADQQDSSGQISGSGGIYTEIGLTGSAKYEVAEKTLRVGLKPAIFTPAVYVSPGSGISYHLYTEKEKITEDGTKKTMEGLFLDTEGGISVYTATSFDDNLEAGRFIVGPTGFDISLEAEYPFLPFLDAGLSLSSIPIAPAILKNEMRMGMEEFSVELEGEALMTGNNPAIGKLNFSDPVYNNNVEKKVHRPLRFDVFARYKPFKSELLVVRPNIGFSVNVNKGDEKGYFNAGLELSANLIELFTFYLGSGYQEEIWRQRIGLGVNLRAFELDLLAVFRDQTFGGCFMGRGFGISLGMRFGW